MVSPLTIPPKPPTLSFLPQDVFSQDFWTTKDIAIQSIVRSMSLLQLEKQMHGLPHTNTSRTSFPSPRAIPSVFFCTSWKTPLSGQPWVVGASWKSPAIKWKHPQKTKTWVGYPRSLAPQTETPRDRNPPTPTFDNETFPPLFPHPNPQSRAACSPFSSFVQAGFIRGRASSFWSNFLSGMTYLAPSYPLCQPADLRCATHFHFLQRQNSYNLFPFTPHFPLTPATPSERRTPLKSKSSETPMPRCASP